MSPPDADPVTASLLSIATIIWTGDSPSMTILRK